MMRRLAIVIGLGFALWGAVLASAKAQEGCSPAAPFLAQLAELPGWVVTTLDDKQTAALVEVIKAGGNPDLDASLNKGYLIERPDGSGAAVLGKADQVCGMAALDPFHFLALKHTILGENL